MLLGARLQIWAQLKFVNYTVQVLTNFCLIDTSVSERSIWKPERGVIIDLQILGHKLAVFNVNVMMSYVYIGKDCCTYLICTTECP